MSDGPLPEFTREEYDVVKAMLEDFEKVERDYKAKSGRRFREAETAELREFDDFRATLRAYAEGYEAAHPEVLEDG